MKTLKYLLIMTSIGLYTGCQIKETAIVEKPTLMVGIVIDQMRAEYLDRFHDNYTEDGFKRLLREGFYVKNTHYNYIPTATGPGHASIYTGATPTNHGIVSNDWYSRKLEKKIYCCEDASVFLIDSDYLINSKEVSIEGFPFSRSPKNLMCTSITDELKLFSNGRSKVIGISMKDRGAIFPAGHMADAAYWYNERNGHFVTSSYYMNSLPAWLVEFNAAHKADALLNSVWKPLLPIEQYVNSGIDNASFEKKFIGKESSTFPYDLKKLRVKNKNFGLLKEIPFGNTLLTELAIATLQGENLGKGKETDFLTISYSSTDYIGHHFGIRSKELEDTYVRMDREIGQLLAALDKEVGKGNYTLFLTADHAASDHPVFLNSVKLSGGFYNSQKIKEALNTQLCLEFGNQKYVAFMDKTQIYFKDTDISKEVIIAASIQFLKTLDGVKEVFALGYKDGENYSRINPIIKNSFHAKESGDILLHFYAGWMEERSFGTTHGNAYTSDTHVPLLWYGNGIEHGETLKAHSITQIAPSLSFLLGIPLPNASDVHPIEALFKSRQFSLK